MGLERKKAAAAVSGEPLSSKQLPQTSSSSPAHDARRTALSANTCNAATVSLLCLSYKYKARQDYYGSAKVGRSPTAGRLGTWSVTRTLFQRKCLLCLQKTKYLKA